MRFLRVNRQIRRQISLIALILLAILVALFWRHFMSSNPVRLTATQQVEVIQTDEPIQAIPINIAVDSNKVALGEKLFQDTRLSSDNRVSCVSCHIPD
jgi:cytochrome c peroxidase